MVHKEENEYSLRIPAHVHTCMELLAQNEFESYLVGGAVRDLLLGSTPADFDLATDATPENMLDVFADFKTIPT